MAIDTIEKRKSAASMVPFMPVGIEPDGTKPQAWRQTAGHGYYGILVAAVAVFLDGIRIVRTFVDVPLATGFTDVPVARAFTDVPLARTIEE